MKKKAAELIKIPKTTFFKEFKDFISRGNVMDMAVGVVVGGAFSKIVTGLVTYVINPFVGLFMYDGGLDALKTVIKPAVTDDAGAVVTEEVAILWGTWLQTILDFFIIALCIFIVMRIIVRVKNTLEFRKIAEEKAKKAEADAKAKAEKEEADRLAAEAAARAVQLEESSLQREALLREILEELKKNASAAN